MRKLNFPTYEYIKALSKEYEYNWKLFKLPTSLYGRFSYNEDGSGLIFFDVMKDGYSGTNSLGMTLKFNKANYVKICEHAQYVLDLFYKSLDTDCSEDWEDYGECCSGTN